jgi:type VI secretion system secreted protein Hcp
MYLKLDGIDGESTAERHAKEIDILEFTDGFALITAATTGGRGVGKAVCDGFTLKKHFDTASIGLIGALANGTAIAGGLLTFEKAGEGAKVFLTVSLTGVRVTSVAQAAVPDDAISETVTLVPAGYEFSYRPQDPKGNPGNAVKFAGSC